MPRRDPAPAGWRIVLRRLDTGQHVDEWTRTSRYAAKRLKRAKELEYDTRNYTLEVLPPKSMNP